MRVGVLREQDAEPGCVEGIFNISPPRLSVEMMPISAIQAVSMLMFTCRFRVRHRSALERTYQPPV